MITNAIINAGYYSLQFIGDLLPYSTGFPTEVGNAFSTIGGHTKALSEILPISATLTCLVLWIVMEGLIFAFKNSQWIGSHIPFIGGKGN